MLKKMSLNKDRQRWTNYFWLFLSFLFLVFFYINRASILENDSNVSSKIKIASIAFCWIIGVVIIFVKLDFGKVWNRVLNVLYILFAPLYIFLNMEIAVFSSQYTFKGLHLSLLVYNLLLIGILELVFIVITNRVRLGTDICAFICVMFNVVNHFVYEFRGTPIIASDLATIGTAMEVADGYKIQFNYYTALTLILLFDFILIGRVLKCEHFFKKGVQQLCGIAVMAVVCVVGFTQVIMSDFVADRGLYLSLFQPMRSYQKFGSIASFTRSIKLSVPEKPEDYSLEKVEEITSKYTSDTVDTSKKRPNVIVVINEAFCDPKVLADIETNEDYMPFIHSLLEDENTVSGTTYASILGGQTANTEYEFLTGNSMSFLPKGAVAFQLYMKHAMPSMVTEQFKKYMNAAPKIYTVPVGSLTELKYPAKGKKRKPFSIITASRLASEKHIDWIVEAVAIAKKEVPEITLDIYGQGGEKAKIQEKIRECNAESYIKLRGQHNLTEVYQNYELYLAGSTSEGFGLTLMEAVGGGLPIIGFDVRYGNPTFIDDGQNGYLIPIDDETTIRQKIDGLAEKVIKLFKEADLEAFHQHSYEVAKSYLTEEVEKRWAKIVD